MPCTDNVPSHPSATTSPSESKQPPTSQLSSAPGWLDEARHGLGLPAQALGGQGCRLGLHYGDNGVCQDATVVAAATGAAHLDVPGAAPVSAPGILDEPVLQATGQSARGGGQGWEATTHPGEQQKTQNQVASCDKASDIEPCTHQTHITKHQAAASGPSRPSNSHLRPHPLCRSRPPAPGRLIEVHKHCA